MKNLRLISLRAAALAVTLLVLPSGFAQTNDRAAQILAATGSVRLAAVGPYVAVGTYLIQVSTKLGSPSSILPDGTWLYEGFTIDDSNASGTLVVRFQEGRVSSLSLASPVVVIALRTQTRKPGGKVLVATQ